MMTFRQGREERVSDGLEDWMVRDFEGGGQRQVRWIEERFMYRGVFIMFRSVRSACSHENIEGWWHIIIDVDWEIKGMGDATLKDKGRYVSARAVSTVYTAVVAPSI